MYRVRHLLSGLLAAACCSPASALAAPLPVSIHAAFRPKIPGHSTTVYLRVQIRPPHGQLVPPPLVELNLKYPAGLSLALSGLGIDACTLATLELLGPEGCPPDSLMGRGGAVAEFPVHHEVFRETAKIVILRGAEQAGHPTLLICVFGETAVDAQLVLSTAVLPADGPYGGLLNIDLPLVESLPEAPDVAVAEMQLVLGPPDLVYTEDIHEREVRYKPKGIPLPSRCPGGGYHFAVALRFQGGLRAAARTTVPCPAKRTKRHPSGRSR